VTGQKHKGNSRAWQYFLADGRLVVKGGRGYKTGQWRRRPGLALGLGLWATGDNPHGNWCVAHVHLFMGSKIN
jgi:hypothetical protein